MGLTTLRKQEKSTPFYALLPSSESRSSVRALERRDSFALVLVKGLVDDIAVLDGNVWRTGIVPSKGVLHPVLVVTLQGPKVRHATCMKVRTDLWEVLASMCTTGLLASRSSRNGLDSTLEKVAKLKSLYEVTIRASLCIVHYDGPTTYEFQIMLLSLIPTSLKELKMPRSFSTPSSKLS